MQVNHKMLCIGVTTLQSEAHMSSSNASLFLLAASTLPNEEQETSLGMMRADLREAVLAKQAKATEAATDAAAEQVMELISSMSREKNAARTQIRGHRQAIASQVKKMDSIDRAFAYGNATSNYLPLLVALGKVRMSCVTRYGHMTPSEFSQLSVVPEDWKPEENSDSSS